MVFPFGNEWADENGNLYPVYGAPMENLAEGKDGKVVDQIVEVVEQIKKNPDSRRPSFLLGMQQKFRIWFEVPCHALFQFYVADGKLSYNCIKEVLMYFRSSF